MNDITIRMYCHGLGDCFLLTFAREGQDSVRVLIDCGVLQRTPGEHDKLRQVAENLKKDTRGKIDLLIVTHEHWDHVAGFSHAQDIFEGITFGRVWLSWAENPDDPDARAVKSDLGKKKKKTQAAIQHVDARLAAAGNDSYAAAMRNDMKSVNYMLDFYGPVDGPMLGAGKKGMTLGATMDWLRGKVRPGDWCSPGERRTVPGVDGVNVYVLGPPRSVAAIRKMDPSGDQGYKFNLESMSLFGAIDALPDGADPAASPFGDEYRLSAEQAKLHPFFREVYGFPDDELGDERHAWRRIDNVWVSGVGHLALQLDTGVNNTSLALAFELPNGRTLIFPGDAQIGNWLSWDKVKFKGPDGKELPLTTKELLNRAIFYKVGHHGSHNATRRVGGLEEMTGGELVAMIPTDEAFALTQSPPHGWKMPFATLYDTLKAHTRHRILRADRRDKDINNVPDGAEITTAAWETFRARVDFADELLRRDPNDKRQDEQPLYVEYTISD